VAASTTIGTYALPEVLARLARSHPLVRVDLQIANTQEVGEAVLAMEVDMGLIEAAATGRGWRSSPGCATNWSSWHRRRTRWPSRRAASRWACSAAQAAWLLREAGSGTREMVEHALLPHLHQLPAAPRWAAPRRLHAVSSRGWASAVCRACWCSHSCRRALEILPTTLPRMWRNFSLVQRAGKRRSPALQAFVDACKAGAAPLKPSAAKRQTCCSA
jgi:DNA-binding transcriptional LysR family regulator